jgi:hypothetical protein
MTKKTDPELLLALLSTYCSGVTNSLETVAAMNGVSFRSVYTWLRDPEITVPEFMGEPNITFGKAMNLARNVSKVLTVGRSLEDRVLNGLKVQVWHHGQPSYVDDEKAILVEDLDMREMLFGYRDGKKRDADGNRIIATRVEAPPAQLVEVYARANMPSIYGHKTETTIKGNVSLGVTTIAPAIRRPIPPEALPYATAADLEGVTETTLVNEVYEPADTGLDDLLGLEVTDTEPDEPAAAAAPEPDDEPAPAPGVRGPETMITSAPTERETSPSADPLLNVAPGWRREYQALLDRNETNAANARKRMLR